MEQNQDVIVYYNLLLFRHNLQLDYMYSKPGVNLNSRFDVFKRFAIRIIWKECWIIIIIFRWNVSFQTKRINPCAEFLQGCREKLDSFDCDELEKAEFYFKASEVYYHMKQTIFSMNYASRAYNLFKKYDTYGERRVQSQFIIAGNWLDHMYPEKLYII